MLMRVEVAIVVQPRSKSTNQAGTYTVKKNVLGVVQPGIDVNNYCPGVYRGPGEAEQMLGAMSAFATVLGPRQKTLLEAYVR
jgi:hypothetical protein